MWWCARESKREGERERERERERGGGQRERERERERERNGVARVLDASGRRCEKRKRSECVLRDEAFTAEQIRHLRQPRPASGLDFPVKVLKSFSVVPSSLGRGGLDAFGRGGDTRDSANNVEKVAL